MKNHPSFLYFAGEEGLLKHSGWDEVQEMIFACQNRKIIWFEVRKSPLVIGSYLEKEV